MKNQKSFEGKSALILLNPVADFAQFLSWQGNIENIVGTQRIHEVSQQKKNWAK